MRRRWGIALVLTAALGLAAVAAPARAAAAPLTTVCGMDWSLRASGPGSYSLAAGGSCADGRQTALFGALRGSATCTAGVLAGSGRLEHGAEVIPVSLHAQVLAGELVLTLARSGGGTAVAVDPLGPCLAGPVRGTGRLTLLALGL